MRVGAMKKELESYGISTKSFVEKSEVVAALLDARAKGMKPKETKTTTSHSKAGSTGASATAPVGDGIEDAVVESVDTATTKKKKKRRSDADTAAESTTAFEKETEEEEKEKDTRPREERLAEQLEACKAMKAGELKKELEELGISTKSFFEKGDFVKALAEARVDGIKKKKRYTRPRTDEEGYAEYTNVEVLTDDASGPRQRNTDQQQRQSSSRSSPFGGAGAGGSPFGGAAGMGGMGGMGGIADMLKNMGMGGAVGGPAGAASGNPFGGANPFGGMGGMGGDAMGKAQEMMKNPKVMELVMKAQGNPKIMAALQECMSNPAAFAKYQNDPEVSELVNELKKYM